MEYKIIKDGEIINVIVADRSFVEEYCSKNGFAFEEIISISPTPTAAEQRENAYNTQPIVEWDGDMLTVTQAAQLWQYYAAEGSDKAAELRVLIAAAKQTIREQYPD